MRSNPAASLSVSIRPPQLCSHHAHLYPLPPKGGRGSYWRDGIALRFCPQRTLLPGAREGNYVRANIFELESFCRQSFEKAFLFQLADKPQVNKICWILSLNREPLVSEKIENEFYSF